MTPVVLLWLWLITVPSNAFATTYYVDKNHGSASDGNAGTSTSVPWLTVGKCVSTLVAGDTCQIRTGTYPEYLTINTSGTSGSRITYENYPGETPIIDGSGTATNQPTVWSQPRLFQINADYITLRGLEIKNPCSIAINIPSGANFVYLIDLHVHDCYLACYYISGDDGQIINNHVHHAHDNIAPDDGGNADCISITGSAGDHADSWLIEGNNLHDCSDDGLDTWVSGGSPGGHTIRHNLVHDIGIQNGNKNCYKLGGSQAGGHNLVYNNIAYNCGAVGFNNNSGPSNEIYNNLAYNTTSHCFLNYDNAGTYKNNIAASCGGSQFSTSGPASTQTTNNWNLSLTCTFVSTDPANGNFLRHAAASACIGVGTDLSVTFTTDYVGNTRSVPWDLGAYEYIAGGGGGAGGGGAAGASLRPTTPARTAT